MRVAALVAVSKVAGSVRSLDDVRRTDDWDEWHALAEHAPPFLTPEFFQLTEPLATGAPVVVEAREDGALVGVLPLARQGRTLFALRSDETPSFDYWGDADGLDAIWGALGKDKRWDVLSLKNVPASSVLVTRLRGIAERDGAKVIVKPDAVQPYFDLPGFEANIRPKFLQNLRRCARKAGGITLERLPSPTRSDFRAALAIEAMAWKGAAGTSIEADRRVAHLYDALTRVFGRRGKACLSFVVAGGERIAQLLSIEDDHTLYALKIGYDPHKSALSPGHLVVWAVAADAERRGLQTFDFVGRDDEWKRKWTDRTHECVTLVVYRHSARGLALHALREIVKPRIPDRIRTAPLRHGCQHDDKLAPHSTFELAKDRLAQGLGIRQGLRRALAWKRPARPPRLGQASRFEPGTWVRVRDEAALRATLDAENRLRGLAFVPVQATACGHVYRVQKQVRRMIDDHGRMRAISNTVLLEGVTCAGPGPEPAGCGRHCPLLFRDEWLEPVAAPALPPPEPTTRRHARVKSMSEIRATLDLHGKHDGVSFMPEMAQWADKRFVVAGRLEEVFELDEWMAPRKPVYILEGLHCSGAALGKRGPCDRSCAILWHEDWLHLDPAPQ